MFEGAGVYQYETNCLSHEYFSPGPRCATRTASARSAIFNLVSTIIGGGILSLPYTFEKCGLIVGTILMIISAVGSTFSFYVIVSCSRRGAVTTYEEIVRKALGPNAGFITVLLLVILTFLTLVAYIILSKDLLASLLDQYIYGRLLTDTEKNIFTIIWVGLCLPVALYKSMDSLRFISLFSTLSCVTLAIAVSVQAIKALSYTANGENYENSTGQIVLDSTIPIKWFPSNYWDALYAFPIICVSFIGHFNVMPVYRELRKPTRRRLKIIVCLTMVAAWALYMVVAVMGYLAAFRIPGGVQDDILNNFDTGNLLMNMGRVGLLITILTSIPIILLPCRSNAIRLGEYLLGIKDTIESSVMERKTMLPTNEEASGSSSSSATSDSMKIYAPEPTLTIHVLTTIMILALSVALALVVPGVAVVWNLMGSTVGLIVAYVLPCISYICIRQGKGHSDRRKATAWFIFLTSSLLCAFCSIQAIAKIL